MKIASAHLDGEGVRYVSFERPNGLKHKATSMTHLDHLTSLIDLDGLSVVDVGCGDGKFARAFARRGALVTGVEIDDRKVEIARAAVPSEVRILLGRAESLPLDDASADLVCFMFSWHHVPQNRQEEGLDESLRVLRPGGRLHLLEPLPGGPMSEVMAPLDDETEVRTLSQARLDDVPARGRFSLQSRHEYAIAYKTPDFETYISRLIAVDPRRAAKLPAVRDAMEATFDRLGQTTEDGVMLTQPCVAYHFQKAG